MNKLLIGGLFLSFNAIAGGYYYPVPANPPPITYALPPAYVVPQQQIFLPPPVYIPPIQRGYYPPPPEGWASTPIVPRRPRIDLSPNE
jgi:hypothetical protein